MAPEPPAARCLRRLPGRLRLRIDERRGDRRWFDQVALALATARGVERVTTSPRIGSLLIEHSGAADEVLREAAAQGLFALRDDEPTPRAGTVGDGARDRLEAVAAAASTAEWVAMVLFLAALVQLRRGQILPPAVSLLAYAASALLAARERQASNDAAAEASSQARSEAPPPS